MPDEPTGRQQNPKHGNSVAYIVSRLERDGRHDLVQAIRDERVSAFAVAAELGWVTRPPTLRALTNQAKRRQGQFRAITGEGLSAGQAMELWLGPNHSSSGSLFNSREELVQAWTEHRDEIMRQWGSHGRRPAAYYEFEWDGPRPPYATERSTLWRAPGVLSESERIEVETEWQREFAAARGKSARERREHYEFHDIPNELVERWQGERRRRSKPRKRDDVALIPQPSG